MTQTAIGLSYERKSVCSILVMTPRRLISSKRFVFIGIADLIPMPDRSLIPIPDRLLIAR
jgi:hypothetical protein